MKQAPAPIGLPPSLRFLKILVIVLMITLIIGVITVVGALVTRMPASFGEVAAGPALPDSITLPGGARAQAVTFGAGWIAVVTTDEQILVYSATGALQQQLALRAISP